MPEKDFHLPDQQRLQTHGGPAVPRPGGGTPREPSPFAFNFF